MHASSCLILYNRCLQLEAQALRVVLQLLPQLRCATKSLPLQQDMLYASLSFVHVAQLRRNPVPYQDLNETSRVSMLCQGCIQYPKLVQLSIFLTYHRRGGGGVGIEISSPPPMHFSLVHFLMTLTKTVLCSSAASMHLLLDHAVSQVKVATVMITSADFTVKESCLCRSWHLC